MVHVHTWKLVIASVLCTCICPFCCPHDRTACTCTFNEKCKGGFIVHVCFFHTIIKQSILVHKEKGKIRIDNGSFYNNGNSFMLIHVHVCMLLCSCFCRE